MSTPDDTQDFIRKIAADKQFEGSLRHLNAEQVYHDTGDAFMADHIRTSEPFGSDVTPSWLSS